MKQRNEKGIAHLGVIIAALVVTAAVAFGGWYVWQKNGDNKTDKSNDSQGNNSQSNKESTDPSEEGKYLVIKEWGVKIPLSSKISGAYYIIDDQGDVEYARLYETGMDQTQNADGNTCSGDKAVNIFVIGRISKSVFEGLDKEDRQIYEHEGFRQYDFSSAYLFSGVGYHQAEPSCAYLKSGELDKGVGQTAYEKKLAFQEAFTHFKAE